MGIADSERSSEKNGEEEGRIETWFQIPKHQEGAEDHQEAKAASCVQRDLAPSVMVAIVSEPNEDNSIDQCCPTCRFFNHNSLMHVTM